MSTKEATEFQRRRNLPGVEVKYMFAGKVSDVVLKLMGKEIGTKTSVSTKRLGGKTTQVLYHLPKLEE